MANKRLRVRSPPSAGPRRPRCPDFDLADLEEYPPEVLYARPGDDERTVQAQGIHARARAGVQRHQGCQLGP